MYTFCLQFSQNGHISTLPENIVIFIKCERKFRLDTSILILMYYYSMSCPGFFHILLKFASAISFVTVHLKPSGLY